MFPRPVLGTILFALLAAGVAARAGAPSVGTDGLGRTQIDFEDPPIFDFARTSHTVSGGVTHVEEVTHDAAGRIRGHFVEVSAGGGVAFETAVTGSIRRRGGRAVFVQRLRSAGDLGNGDVMESLGTARGQITGSGQASALVTAVATKNCLTLENPLTQHKKRICKTSRVEQVLDYAHAGDWRLRLTLLRIGSRIEGLAELTVAAAIAGRERSAELTVRGTLAGDAVTLRLLPAQAPKPVFGGLVLRGRAQVTGDDEVTLTAVEHVAGLLLGQRFSEGTE